MSHKHWCDVAGHDWECNDSACMCFCGERMEQGDHSDCPIGLRACPRHPVPYGLAEGEEPGGVPIQFPADIAAKAERAAQQLEQYGAVCLWCGHGYEDYSRKSEDEHFAFHCPDAPAELRENAEKRLKKATPRR
jgi:hypothetical protein